MYVYVLVCVWCVCVCVCVCVFMFYGVAPTDMSEYTVFQCRYYSLHQWNMNGELLEIPFVLKDFSKFREFLVFI